MTNKFRTDPPVIPSKLVFIAIMASLMAINAISIDIMLPGLQQIGESLGEADENLRQFVITAYLIGMGVAQLVFGPVSDRFGRKIPLLCGLAIYALSALAIVFVPSFCALLMLRAVQGVGAAATRVITVSVIRDVYGGHQMAEIMSLVMMIFMVVPVIAPSIGQLILVFAEWHMIFFAIGLYALVVAAVVSFRLPETLAKENRRSLSTTSIFGAFRVVLTNRIAFCYMTAASFVFGALFGFVNSAQQILVGAYGLGAWFPLVFASFAIVMATSSFMSSALVGRFGMRRLSHAALIGFTVVSLVWVIISMSGLLPFWLFSLFYGLAMIQFGLITSNFNAMAMEPLSHVAGTAASILGFTQTIGGGLIGALIGQAFNGSVTPLATGFLTCGVIGLLFVLIAEKGRLFQMNTGMR
jgi:DHA1 family bicyclomycin/chloramphenicol resistance-like MFS transporter